MKYNGYSAALMAMLLWSLIPARVGAQLRVACLGNSITYGTALPDPQTQCYPTVLQQLLGDGYKVENFGHAGAAVLIRGHHPYTQTQEYAAALAFRPDIAVIHLGVNDTDPRSWPNFHEDFTADYLHIIAQLRVVNPDVRILIVRLSPLRATHKRFRSGTRIWRLQAQDYIERVARDAHVELIDFDEPLRYRQDLLHDGIHPNAEGAALLADEVYRGITGRYGPLSMSPIYSSGMVLPHSRYLTLHGKSDAHARIAITIDGHTYRAQASNRGRWQVTIPPLFPGKSYTLRVTDGKDMLVFDNILAGVVWIASGQSNMAFTLAEDAEGAKAIADAADSQLRFFAMQPRFMTDNRRWNPQQVDTVNRLQYFRPAVWQAVDAAHARQLSAVAYYFARQLRDSLHLPVGIIQNAVGGPTTGSWVDVHTLEEVMPELLVNWRTNDYVQPWAQGRAVTNSGREGRHPYEPSYLFSAGIAPLDHYPVDGVIWYQGESNAHNIELHEVLFKALVGSWRNYFQAPELPFYFAQLSSLSRPSWPAFRHSQRLLAQAIPHTAMAVTHDHGDSLNVHPVHKRPVGERLARLALQHTYGFAIEAHGPEPVTATLTADGIRLTFDHAQGLTTADGATPRTFEVAGDNRVWHSAKASVADDGSAVWITGYGDFSPRYVRYAWQPFTRANLTNGQALPASTFEIAVSPVQLIVPEPGFEAGLSGCFAARIGDKLVLAGGCNFPGSPLAAAAQKRFYQGIYIADTLDGEWRLMGQLATPMAYGATAVTPRGMVLVGGTTATRPLTDCHLLRIIDGKPVLTALPHLPVAVDNAYAAAIGNRVYLAGGNVDGRPSRTLFMLDLDAALPTWQRLKDMPGNPRVQPVMAVGRHASGEECLYVFGGFAARHDGHEPTLELNGLCYVPSSGKWLKVAGPHTPEGKPLAVGGGAACTLTGGDIAVCGGVNKDIFIEALRKQAPDYLTHEPSWYRFNPYTVVFHPATSSWSVAYAQPEATARAGAAIFVGTHNDFYLYGGELKPRVRSSELSHLQYDRQDP